MKIDKKDICCPHCKTSGTWRADNPFRPFCNERCKLIDLGAWADESRRIPGDPIPQDNLNTDEQD